MRMLFTTWAWPSHLYAMVPTAWAARLAGHEVLVAAPPALGPAVAATGLPGAPIGYDVDAVAVFRAIAAAPPGARGGPRVLELLTALADSMTKDLAELAVTWGADLVVSDPTAFAGPIAARVAGVPAVRHLYGTDLMSAAGDFLPGVVEPLANRYGVSDVDPFGVATVDPCPASLQVPLRSRRLAVRAVPHNGPGGRPANLPERGPRPLVAVTWGTTLSRLDPAYFLAGDVLRALAEVDQLDVDLVAVVSPAQRELLGELPARVTVLESAPLRLVLPAVDLLVGHGGAGSILTGLARGLPQLHVPRLPDHVRHAARLDGAGAGRSIPVARFEQPDGPAELREAVRQLLGSPGARAAAEHLRAETAAQPTYPELIRELEQVVRDFDRRASRS